MKKRGIIIFLCMMLLSLSLVGCLSKKEEAKEPAKEEKTTPEEVAKADAKTLLAFLYEGKKGTIQDVTGMTGADTTAYLEESLYERKMKDYPGDDWRLVVDGSTYTAEEIMKEYSRISIKSLQNVTYSVEKVKITKDTAEVTTKIDPIALKSVANAITVARSQIFGDINTSKMILDSQNKDIKAINNLLNFKLYSIIYGDRNYPIDTVGEEKEITFTMTKEGDHYQVTKDTLDDIVGDSGEVEYTKKGGSTEDKLKDKSLNKSDF
ncbi:hypothetical protein [Kroppenstedtia eburnea]|uniref:DUF5105 domain-containing protein n=1 Tax=Kroppenstedtia eburnea TaxID=714067 RepID=A0A1N7KQ57_9BACL|nr:hypothetical protein [Kroppenstedtia eburnea]QKI82866.1 hypothetical protein GXN75_13155 [Kroppenstedtia eburnea]SIS63694.1 hypothetical protein SAMN05421790_103206 [Kroppenstedtia eburnea]